MKSLVVTLIALLKGASASYQPPQMHQGYNKQWESDDRYLKNNYLDYRRDRQPYNNDPRENYESRQLQPNLTTIEILNKYENHIKIAKQVILGIMINDVQSGAVINLSGQNNSIENVYESHILSYKKILIDLSKNSTNNPDLFKQLFIYWGQEIQSDEVNVLIQTLSSFIDDISKRIKLLAKIPFPTAKQLYEKMPEKTKQEFDKGRNIVLDQNSLRVIEDVANYLKNKKGGHRKDSKDAKIRSSKQAQPVFELTDEAINKIEDSILLAIVRLIIQHFNNDRVQCVQNDLTVLQSYLNNKSLEEFKIYSILKQTVDTLSSNANRQWDAMCSSYLSLLKEQINVGDNNTLSLESLDEYKSLVWIQEKQKIQLERPESLKSPFPENDSKDKKKDQKQSTTRSLAKNMEKSVEKTLQDKGGDIANTLVNGLMGKLFG